MCFLMLHATKLLFFFDSVQRGWLSKQQYVLPDCPKPPGLCCRCSRCNKWLETSALSRFGRPSSRWLG